MIFRLSSFGSNIAHQQRPLLRSRLLSEWIFIAVIATAAICALSGWKLTTRFDNLIYDYTAQWLAKGDTDDIVLVAIDEPSLAQLGRWPWNRTTHASMIKRLQDNGASLIGLDVILAEPGDPTQDQALATAFSSSTVSVVLPSEPVTPGTNGKQFDIIIPTPQFAQAIGKQGAIGHVMVEPDSDGVVRRLTPCLVTDDAVLPHFGVEIARNMGSGASCAPSGLPRKPQLFPIRNAEQFRVISYADLLSGRTPAELIRAKTVLVGATANGLGDQFPAGGGAQGQVPGVALIANLALAVRNRDFISPIEPWLHTVISLVPVWFLLLGLWQWTPGQVIRIASLLGLATVLFGLAALSQGYWFAPGAALAGLAFVYPLWGWRRLQATSDYLSEELAVMDRELKRIPLPSSGNVPSDIVADKTQRLSAAISELRELRHFVADSLASLPDPMIVTATDWTIRLANPPATDVLGSSLEGTDLIEQLTLLADPAQAAAMRNWLIRAIATGEYRDASTGEEDPYFEFSAREGKTYAMRATPLDDDFGAGIKDRSEIKGQIVYLADITELTDAQREREHVLQLLSHDMRAPLSSILALIDRPDTEMTEAQRNQRITVQTRRTLALADNFVDLARMESTHFTPDELILAEIVAEAADGLYPIARQKSVEIVVDDQSDLAFMLGEGSSLFRAFTNLLDNALRYSPSGGTIAVRITVAPGYEGDILVEISDEGPGIAPDLLDRLFQRFAAKSGSRTAREGGIGLGLHYVASVVARHGGRVSACNITGKGINQIAGARFSVSLPCAPAQPDS